MGTHCYVASYARRGRNDKIIGAWSEARRALRAVEEHSLEADFTTDQPLTWVGGEAAALRAIDRGGDAVGKAHSNAPGYPYVYYLVTEIRLDD